MDDNWGKLNQRWTKVHPHNQWWFNCYCGIKCIKTCKQFWLKIVYCCEFLCLGGNFFYLLVILAFLLYFALLTNSFLKVMHAFMDKYILAYIFDFFSVCTLSYCLDSQNGKKDFWNQKGHQKEGQGRFQPCSFNETQLWRTTVSKLFSLYGHCDL